MVQRPTKDPRGGCEEDQPRAEAGPRLNPAAKTYSCVTGLQAPPHGGCYLTGYPGPGGTGGAREAGLPGPVHDGCP